MNATTKLLTEIRDLIRQGREYGGLDAYRALQLAEHFEVLDETLASGGALPAAWSAALTREAA